jgi:hypothetical protein
MSRYYNPRGYQIGLFGSDLVRRDSFGQCSERKRSGDQFQVVGFVCNRLVAKGADDRPLAEKEDARHLVPIFLDHAKAMFANGALQPRFPDFRNQKVGKGTFSSKVKDRLGIQGGLRIADPFDV